MLKAEIKNNEPVKTGLLDTGVQKRDSDITSLFFENITELNFDPLFTHLFSQELVEQRELYRQAKQSLDKNQYSSFEKLNSKLKAYPIRYQLEYDALRKRIVKTSINDIQAFQKESGSELLANQLYKAKLNTFLKKEQWKLLTRYFNEELASNKLKCGYARGLYRTGKIEKALAYGKKIWITPKSMPSLCDGIFKELDSNQLISNEMALKRFSRSILAGNINIARYATRYMNPTTKENIIEYLNIYREKTFPKRWQTIANPLEKEFSPTLSSALQSLLFKNLIRKDINKAVKYYRKQLGKQENTLLPDEEYIQFNQEIRQFFVTRQALDDYKNVEKIYNRIGKPEDKKSIEWLLRSKLVQNRWQDVIELINQLDPENKDIDRWQYWYYRAKQLSHGLSEQEKINFIALSKKTNFYGFSASRFLNLPVKVNPEVAFTHKNDLTKILNLLDHKKIRQAIEFFLQKEIYQANRKWYAALKNLDDEQKISAAYLAHYIGWHTQTIYTLAKAEAWQHYFVRFPQYLTGLFDYHAFKCNLPAPWIYATARQESALNSVAVSSAGAVGLMQILPSTARSVATKNKRPYSKRSLFDPFYSVDLGSLYLCELYGKYNNMAISSAAYNAGPRRVDKWLSILNQNIPLDAWIESIPYNETRQYVQNVLSFAMIYQSLYIMPHSKSPLLYEDSFISKTSNKSSLLPFQFIPDAELNVLSSIKKRAYGFSK